MRRKGWILGVVLLATLGLTGAVVAQGGGYDLSWWTVDNGGALNVTAGAYTLSGVAGQPDAEAVSVGGYTLQGGFFSSVAMVPVEYRLYLPVVIRNS